MSTAQALLRRPIFRGQPILRIAPPHAALLPLLSMAHELVELPAGHTLIRSRIPRPALFLRRLVELLHLVDEGFDLRTQGRGLAAGVDEVHHGDSAVVAPDAVDQGRGGRA